jgi:hypothetical protein
MTNGKFILMVPTDHVNDNSEFRDREGGETHSLKAIRDFFVGTEELDVERVAASLEDCLSKLGNVLENLQSKTIGDWEVDTISVSLGISTEGSIGLVSAGMEGSIEVGFKKSPKK